MMEKKKNAKGKGIERRWGGGVRREYCHIVCVRLYASHNQGTHTHTNVKLHSSLYLGML